MWPMSTAMPISYKNSWYFSVHKNREAHMMNDDNNHNVSDIIPQAQVWIYRKRKIIKFLSFFFGHIKRARENIFLMPPWLFIHFQPFIYFAALSLSCVAINKQNYLFLSFMKKLKFVLQESNRSILYLNLN